MLCCEGNTYLHVIYDFAPFSFQLQSLGLKIARNQKCNQYVLQHLSMNIISNLKFYISSNNKKIN